MKTIWKRITSDTPAFFKKIVWGGFIIGGTCTGIILGFEQIGINLSDWIEKILEMGIGIGVVAGVIAKCAKIDLPKEVEK